MLCIFFSLWFTNPVGPPSPSMEHPVYNHIVYTLLKPQRMIRYSAIIIRFGDVVFGKTNDNK